MTDRPQTYRDAMSGDAVNGAHEALQGGGGRSDERLFSAISATMCLVDGRKFAGQVVDMSMGGMLFIAEMSLPAIPLETSVKISMALYGRPSDFSCVLKYHRDDHVGLQLQRG